MKDSSIITEYEAGAQARNSGVPLQRNPHQPASLVLRSSWERGWVDANRDQQRRNRYDRRRQYA